MLHYITLHYITLLFVFMPGSYANTLLTSPPYPRSPHLLPLTSLSIPNLTTYPPPPSPEHPPSSSTSPPSRQCQYASMPNFTIPF